MSVRSPEIAFACPQCRAETTAGLDGRGRCPSCGKETTLELSPALRDGRSVDRCSACAGEQLYVQSDFNQKVGLGIVAVGVLLVPFTPYYSSLAVAVAVDAVLYVVMPKVTICYRCHAHFRGFPRNPEHEAFDLHIAEQYGTKG